MLYEVANWIASGRPIQVAAEAKTTPLHVALELGFHSLVELLVRYETKQAERDRALKQAVQLRRFDLVELLVTHGADPLSVPFDEVLAEWNPEVVRFFLNKGADVVKRAPFAHAFRYKIRTAIGPYLKTKRAHPELARDLQEQADRALRFFCAEGNLKWVSLLMWAGADPRSRGPNMHQWSDETDTDSFTTEIEEACSKGRLDILKRLGIDPNKDDLSEPLKCAGWSGDEHVVRYLLELGVNPNDKPNGGSQALDRSLQKFHFATWGNGPLTSKWRLHSEINCLRLLVEHKARWEPNDHGDINDLRRILFKCDPDVTTELVSILKLNDACADETIRKLLSTPKMKSHLAKQEWQLTRMGPKGIVGAKKSGERKSDTEFRVPYGYSKNIHAKRFTTKFGLSR